MPDIFISYRRKDSAGSTGRVYDRLCLEFGKENIFIDVENIPVGYHFLDYIREQVRACTVVLIMIGPQWTTLTDESGKPRLQDPDDTVHVELATALHEGKTVIPVLVDQATMPKPEDLPADIAQLTFINASELTPNHWEIDVAELVAVLRNVLAQPDQPRPEPLPEARPPAPPLPRQRRRSGALKRLALIALALLAIVAVWLVLDPQAMLAPQFTEAANTTDTQPSDASQALPTVQEVEARLQQVNIVLSTGATEDTDRVRGYLEDPNGAYYLLALSCLEILGDQQLNQTGYLDLIDKWYTNLVGGPQQYLLPDGTLDLEKVKEAIVQAQNEYYGEQATSFDEVLATGP